MLKIIIKTSNGKVKFYTSFGGLGKIYKRRKRLGELFSLLRFFISIITEFLYLGKIFTMSKRMLL